MSNHPIGRNHHAPNRQELDRATLHRVGHWDVATALMREAAVLDWKDRKGRAIAKMKGQSRSRRRATSALPPVATAALRAHFDTLAPAGRLDKQIAYDIGVS